MNADRRRPDVDGPVEYRLTIHTMRLPSFLHPPRFLQPTRDDPDAGASSEWRWLWRAVRPYWRYQAASLGFILAATAAGLTGPLLMKWLIDDVLPQKSWTGLAWVAALIFVTYVGRMLLSSIGGLINLLAVQRLTFQVRKRLLAHLQALPASFHTTHPVGDLVQRLERDVTIVSEMGSDVLPSVARMLVEIAMTVAAMVLLDWQVSLIVVPLLPLFAYVRHHFRARLRRSSEEVRDATGQQSSLLNEILTGAIQVQLLGAEQRLGRRYARLNLKTIERQIHQRKQELLFTLCSMSTVGLGTALIVGYSGARVMMGTLTAGTLVAFYSYIGHIFSPMSTAVELYARMNRVRASIRRLMDIEEEPSAIRDAPDAVPVPARPLALAAHDIGFRYTRPGGETAADDTAFTAPGSTASGPAAPAVAPSAPGRGTLQHIAFEVRAGERVAIVGESGCGKSSLLKLIPRLYDADAGSLTIDGRDLRGFQVRSLRRAISFVPQEPVLFQGTLRDNLRHGSPDATAHAIAQVAWIACLTEVVERLPQRWDTVLGPMGNGLSGGERQRLAIARALLQRRPILILDEATSALDAPTEHRLLTRLDDRHASRLVLLVSHRLAAARWADRVIVLTRGEVVESGTHASLYRPGTHYHALWQRTDDRDRDRPLHAPAATRTSPPGDARADEADWPDAAHDAETAPIGEQPFP